MGELNNEDQTDVTTNSAATYMTENYCTRKLLRAY